MRESSSILQRLSALSPRERRLISLAVALAVVVGLIYGLLMPGLAAARSAESRRAAAAADLASARQLAAVGRLAGAPGDTSGLQVAAQEAGLTLVAVEGGTLRVQAQGPATLLAWLARSGQHAQFDSVVISPASTGGIIAEIRTGGPR